MVDVLYGLLILLSGLVASLSISYLESICGDMKHQSDNFSRFFYECCENIFFVTTMCLFVGSIGLAFKIAGIKLLFVPLIIFIGLFIYGGYRAYIEYKISRKLNSKKETTK